MLYGKFEHGYIRYAQINSEDVPEGWLPCDSLPDDERVSEQDGTIITYHPYVNGSRISYRRTVCLDRAALNRSIEEEEQKLRSSDYKLLKCVEAAMLGEEMPYNLRALVEDRERSRLNINSTETRLFEDAIDFHEHSGEYVRVGQTVSFDMKTYVVRHAHYLAPGWPPTETPALFGLVSCAADGSPDDPIPWESGMISTEGLYYTENDVLYYCFRDSANPLYYTIASLQGLYFNSVQ